ncbi:hypothetical protein QWM81_07740 [Streptomyces ficellus]|uniref:GNAT family N-acetyltransferase n=1 Tax=Streptomyces ficellus TaxID=1977088 RepID=A0ABT7Z380_9ACTN|nr:hypothetical protein [Streptomyces ficellus]MDN3293938.1 hypothetical protein [Streptomyces ficellus]
MSPHLTHAHAPDGVAPVRVRGMAEDDCAAVADIRVRGWQFAYDGRYVRAPRP